MNATKIICDAVTRGDRARGVKPRRLQDAILTTYPLPNTVCRSWNSVGLLFAASGRRSVMHHELLNRKETLEAAWGKKSGW